MASKSLCNNLQWLLNDRFKAKEIPHHPKCIELSYDKK